MQTVRAYVCVCVWAHICTCPCMLHVGDTGASCYTFQLKSLFCEKYVRCIMYINVYIKFSIRINKMYHIINIPYCS